MPARLVLTKSTKYRSRSVWTVGEAICHTRAAAQDLAVRSGLPMRYFHSWKELARWRQLQLLEQAGAIHDLRYQVPYELRTANGFLIEVYVADYTYTDSATGEAVVEDAKGFRTKAYIRKRKWMQEVHGIMIREV